MVRSLAKGGVSNHGVAIGAMNPNPLWLSNGLAE
jgi:hypothetical protein